MNFDKIDKQVDIWIEQSKARVNESIYMNPKLWIWFFNQHRISFISSYYDN